MTLLICGILLWIAVHLIPTLGRPLRQSLISSLGEKGYFIAFSALIVLSLILIVIGWRTTPQDWVYQPASWALHPGMLLMLLAFILIQAGHYASRLKRWIRHPMLVGVVLWSINHLLNNGTTRDLWLFGGLGLWALVEIFLINKRDGRYTAPEPVPLKKEIMQWVIAVVAFVVIILLHPWFTGVPVVSRSL